VGRAADIRPRLAEPARRARFSGRLFLLSPGCDGVSGRPAQTGEGRHASAFPERHGRLQPQTKQARADRRIRRPVLVRRRRAADRHSGARTRGGSRLVGGLLSAQLRELINPDERRGVKKKEVTARCRRRRVSCGTASPRGSERAALGVAVVSTSPLKGSARRALSPWCGVLVVCCSLWSRARMPWPASGRASELLQRFAWSDVR
jgi:hypothetical protein